MEGGPTGRYVRGTILVAGYCSRGVHVVLNATSVVVKAAKIALPPPCPLKYPMLVINIFIG